MHPRIPLPGVDFGIPTYGLMVATGFLVALWLAERLGRRHGFLPGVVQDMAVWACIAGLVGAKIALLIVEPSAWREVWRTLFQAGVFYGGFIGATIALLFLCWRRRISLHALGDVLAAPIALGHAFGRVGCFLAGCCWGTPCDAPWAVHYTHPESMPVQAGWAAFTGLHPVQLYETAGNVVLAGLLLVLLARRRFEGQVVWTYVVAYGVLRFTLEFYRGDQRGSIGPLSTSQAIGACAVIAGLGLLAWRAAVSRRTRPAPAGDALPTPAPPAPAP